MDCRSPVMVSSSRWQRLVTIGCNRPSWPPTATNPCLLWRLGATRDQRLAREIGRLQLQIQEITPQRVDDVSLTFGNVARILATRT